MTPNLTPNRKPTPGLGGFKHNKYMNSIGKDGSFDADMKFFMEHPNDTAEIKKSYKFKDVTEVVPILHQAGAKIFVSAEYFKDKSTFKSTVDKAIALGVDGFECYRNLDNDLEEAMVTYAKGHNMLISGGGNGHGSWTDPSKYSIGISNVHFDNLKLGTIKIHWN